MLPNMFYLKTTILIFTICVMTSFILFIISKKIFKRKRKAEGTKVLNLSLLLIYSVCVYFFVVKITAINIFIEFSPIIIDSLVFLSMYLCLIYIYKLIYRGNFISILKTTYKVPTVIISVYIGLLLSSNPIGTGLTRGLLLALLIILTIKISKLYKVMNRLDKKMNLLSATNYNKESEKI